jgi:hypothetical protein
MRPASDALPQKGIRVPTGMGAITGKDGECSR